MINLQEQSALATLEQERRDEHRKKKLNREADDEAVADLYSSTGEESEDSDMLDAEDAATGSLVATEAANQARKKGGKADTADEKTNITAAEAHASLHYLFLKEEEIMRLVYSGPKAGGPANPEMFFIRHLVVPPNNYRPANKQGSEGVTEAQTNDLYKAILSACDAFRLISQEASRGTRSVIDVENAWVRLQDSVNSLIDREKNPVQGLAGRRNADGVKQNLEKKEGMFRKNMMGKRVNFAARSVISPDPNIETNEIGVPPVFAIKLTYPEPVTDHNF